MLFGTQPNNPYGDSGTMGGTTLRFSGATSSACIVVGGGTSEAWTGIKSLAIDGAEVTNPIPAIVVEGGYNVTLDNLYLDQPFNGILVSATSTTHINRVVVDGARGVYGFLLTGTSGGVTDTVDMIDIDVSGNVITLPTNATAASGASVISVAATGSGVVSGMMAGGSYSLQAGTTVVSAGASTVSLSRPLTASIASGTTLSFGQIGLWIDSNCNGASVVFPRNTALSTALYIASSTAGTPPSDLRIYDIDAQSLAADSVVNLAGNTVSLLAPMISGGSGRGIAFGAAATDMSVIGGGITLQAYTGVEIAGTGFQIEQSVVGENSQASTGLYNGIVVSSGASRVRIVGNQIGYAAGASLQQGYGISNLDSTAGEILVIGNDLRGNSGGPISGGGPAILGANLGIATGGYTNSTSSSFTLNPSDTYVGIVNTGSTAVNIHLPTTPSYNQEIEIKDESGTAQTHTINIYPPAGSSVTIQGAINTGINSNYGSLKLRFNNDLTWFFVS